MRWGLFIFAGVATAIVLTVIGGLWHWLLFEGFYARQLAAVADPEPSFGLLVLTDLLRGFVLAYVFPLGFKGGNQYMEGLRFGLLMGLVSGLPLGSYAGQLMIASSAWFAAELLFYLLQTGIAGMALGAIYGRSGGVTAGPAD